MDNISILDSGRSNSRVSEKDKQKLPHIKEEGNSNSSIFHIDKRSVAENSNPVSGSEQINHPAINKKSAIRELSHNQKQEKLNNITNKFMDIAAPFFKEGQDIIIVKNTLKHFVKSCQEKLNLNGKKHSIPDIYYGDIDIKLYNKLSQDTDLIHNIEKICRHRNGGSRKYNFFGGKSLTLGTNYTNTANRLRKIIDNDFNIDFDIPKGLKSSEKIKQNINRLNTDVKKLYGNIYENFTKELVHFKINSNVICALEKKEVKEVRDTSEWTSLKSFINKYNCQGVININLSDEAKTIENIMKFEKFDLRTPLNMESGNGLSDEIRESSKVFVPVDNRGQVIGKVRCYHSIDASTYWIEGGRNYSKPNSDLNIDLVVDLVIYDYKMTNNKRSLNLKDYFTIYNNLTSMDSISFVKTIVMAFGWRNGLYDEQELNSGIRLTLDKPMSYYALLMDGIRVDGI